MAGRHVIRVGGAVMCSLWLLACGDDGSAVPVGTDSEGNGEELDEQGRVLADVLTQSMQRAFFASLVADPASIQGQDGCVVISGDIWTFTGYSPDGQLYIDGELTVRKELYPDIPAAGELNLTGSHTGTLTVDIQVHVQGGQLVTTGTLELNGEVWRMEDLRSG